MAAHPLLSSIRSDCDVLESGLKVDLGIAQDLQALVDVPNHGHSKEKCENYRSSFVWSVEPVTSLDWMKISTL